MLLVYMQTFVILEETWLSLLVDGNPILALTKMSLRLVFRLWPIMTFL